MKKDECIQYAIGESSLGFVLVAKSDQGLCVVQFGDSRDEVKRSLRERFPDAIFSSGSAEIQQLLIQVTNMIENPSNTLNCALDIRGTEFQLRVWKALREIPTGSTLSYIDIAMQIGAPKSPRAVATACAANPLVVVIPCHRVVRLDSVPSGYRYGLERKNQLLQREKELQKSNMAMMS